MDLIVNIILVLSTLCFIGFVITAFYAFRSKKNEDVVVCKEITNHNKLVYKIKISKSEFSQDFSSKESYSLDSDEKKPGRHSGAKREVTNVENTFNTELEYA